MTTLNRKPLCVNFHDLEDMLKSQFVEMTNADEDPVYIWFKHVWINQVKRNFQKYSYQMTGLIKPAGTVKLHVCVINDAECTYHITDLDKNPFALDKWNTKQDQYEFYVITSVPAEFGLIKDWMRACPRELPSDITRLSYDQAWLKSETWHERQYNARFTDKIAEGDGTTIRLGIVDGWTVDWLCSEKALDYEGARQRHCVANYWPLAKQGYCLILRICNKEQKKWYTVEIRRSQIASAYFYQGSLHPDSAERPVIAQVRGVCNSDPSYEDDRTITHIVKCLTSHIMCAFSLVTREDPRTLDPGWKLVIEAYEQITESMLEIPHACHMQLTNRSTN